MTDISKTIEAKSDQLNSDDLIGGPITVTIRSVSATSAPDQPISIGYEGDNNKPWKPCKSMRRALVFVWGKDGARYVGRSLTLYRDPSVKWGGQEVGGIRISHVSGIDKPARLSLTATRGNKKETVIQPLQIKSIDKSAHIAILEAAKSQARLGKAAFTAHWQTLSRDGKDVVQPAMQEMVDLCAKADAVTPQQEGELSDDE